MSSIYPLRKVAQFGYNDSMPATAISVDFEFHMGDRLRKAREHTELDASAFAEMIGVSRDSIRSYERGITRPRRPVLAAWAVATGYPVDWLVTGCPPGDSNPEPADYGRPPAPVIPIAAKRAALSDAA